MFLSSPAKTFDRESKKEGIRVTEEGKKRGSIDNMVAKWREWAPPRAFHMLIGRGDPPLERVTVARQHVENVHAWQK